MSVRQREFAVFLCSAVLWFCAPAPALAQTSVTAVMTVSMSVTASCSLSVTAVNLGSSTGTAVTAESDVGVTCSNGTAYTIGLHGGANVDATSRRLADGASNFVRYFVYQDAARTVEWGDKNLAGATYNNGNTKDSAGTGAAQTHTAYFSTQTFTTGAPGTYTDTVTVSVVF